jgi:hypothetical protein
MTPVKPNTLAKDLELVMECTTNGYPKQRMMRFPEVNSGEITPVKPNRLAKDLEKDGMHNEQLSQATHDEVLRGLFR